MNSLINIKKAAQRHEMDALLPQLVQVQTPSPICIAFKAAPLALGLSRCIRSLTTVGHQQHYGHQVILLTYPTAMTGDPDTGKKTTELVSVTRSLVVLLMVVFSICPLRCRL